MKHRSLLDRILEPGSLSVVFQPILEKGAGGSWGIYSLECLIRGPKGTNIEKADVLFEYVRRKREERLVDRACVAVAIRGASELPGNFNFSLNVHASTLGRDDGFTSFLGDIAESNGVQLSRLTVEIVEHTHFWDKISFNHSLEELRRMGVRVALDDVGTGESNFRMIIDCHPDMFKVDRYIVENCHADFYRLAVLDSIAYLARRFGAQVVVEGVSTEADLEAVQSLGINLIQGYLFCAALPAAELLQHPVFHSRTYKLAAKGG
ncbi:MAG: EAL domain-containing protein [Pyrinomonadaceae bacterium]